MQQYLDLLKAIKERGTDKPAARANMPGTRSLFGYQLRHDLSTGFPLLTTKKMFWKGIVYELLWFLRGDTNIKYLVDNGVNVWNEDAYNYYCKQIEKMTKAEPYNRWMAMDFEEFTKKIKNESIEELENDSTLPDYSFGDCGVQYGQLWRTLGGFDQIKDLIQGLKNSPESRRHIVTAWNPSTLNDMALNACHVLFQCNCRPLRDFDRKLLLSEMPSYEDQFYMIDEDPSGNMMEVCDEESIPKYKLDLHLYQRSADVVLGVPFNIASYALLVHILCELCNMIPGDLIISYGDVHIYDNHKDAVDEQLTRTPTELPKLIVNSEFWNAEGAFMDELQVIRFEDFQLINYNPQPKIAAELSTGMKK